MPIRVAILGDIVGRPGRLAVAQIVPVLRQQHRCDLVIANAENAANGSGLTPELYDKLCDAGVDGMTLGDHAFRKDKIVPTLERVGNLIRPINLPTGAAGRGVMKLSAGPGKPNVYVITLLGHLFIMPVPNDPFEAIDRALASLPEPNPIVIVEIHAEATSEKQAMGWHLNGRASVVFGTHTHVQTADERILPANPENGPSGGGTAYITDLGMCGPMDSVLGRRIDRVLKHMTTSMPAPFDVAEADPCVRGIVVEIDERTRMTTSIERIAWSADMNRPPFVA
jgi:metallophosphoesterase (TIGR00282 family)